MKQASKSWKFLAAMTMISLALAACNGPTPQPQQKQMVTSSGFECPAPQYPVQITSKTLNLFVWTEYIPTDMVECFELTHGVEINLTEFSTNEEMFAKVSGGGAAYDLLQPSDYIIPSMARRGLLQELDKSKLPSFANYDPSYLNLPFDPGNKYSLPYQAGTEAIVVNTATVKTLPKSWADLWNPEYAGHMVFLDDSRTIIGFALVILGFSPNTHDPHELQLAKEKLASLVPGVKLFDSDSPKTALIAGDVDLGVTWTGEAFLAHQEKESIVYVYPEEGAQLWQDTWVMPVDAPHPDAAYAWLNYSAQGNLFWKMLAEFPYTNPNKAALEFARVNHPELYEPYINSPITNPPAEVIAHGFRIEDVGEAAPLYDQVWTELKGGQ